MYNTLTLGLRLALAAGALSSTALAQSTTGPVAGNRQPLATVAANCNNLTKIKVRTNDTFAGSPFTTTSTSYVAVPGTPITIIVGGTTNSCVVVTVSMMGAVLGASTTERIRAVMGGGSIVALPPEVIFKQNTPPGFVEAGTYQFIFPNVTPGTKTIRIEVKTTTGATAYAFDPIMKVEYR